MDSVLVLGVTTAVAVVCGAVQTVRLRGARRQAAGQIADLRAELSRSESIIQDAARQQTKLRAELSQNESVIQDGVRQQADLRDACVQKDVALAEAASLAADLRAELTQKGKLLQEGVRQEAELRVELARKDEAVAGVRQHADLRAELAREKGAGEARGASQAEIANLRGEIERLRGAVTSGRKEGADEALARFTLVVTPFKRRKGGFLTRTWEVGYTQQVAVMGFPVLEPQETIVECQREFDEKRLMALIDAATRVVVENALPHIPAFKRVLNAMAKG